MNIKKLNINKINKEEYRINLILEENTIEIGGECKITYEYDFCMDKEYGGGMPERLWDTDIENHILKKIKNNK
jgi:hypothetical protein